jgi:hypothetical protein
VNREKKEKRADFLVKIFATAAKEIESGTLLKQVLCCKRPTNLIKRAIANRGIGGRYDAEEIHDRSERPSRQQFHQAAQDFVSVLSIESKRKLGRQKAVFDAYVISMAFEFTGQVAFAFCQFCQRR